MFFLFAYAASHAAAGSSCTFADPSLLPPGKSSRLVGVVSLSFSEAGREDFQSLAPPAQQPYLSNMAVDPKFRRWVLWC
jgi:hypothetical protein